MVENKEVARQEAAEWYFRRDAGALSAEEDAQFQLWFAVPAHRRAYEELAATWAALGTIPRTKTPLPARPPVWRGRTGLAGAALAAAIVLALIIPQSGWFLLWQADAATAIGETREVTLADGSIVTLNTDSAIAIAYDTSERRIRLLRGEALFTVAKDAGRPFTVETQGGTAQALGTAFTVRDEDDGATVAVVESRVAVRYPANAAGTVTVSPGEAVSYAHGRLGPVEPVDIDELTAWRRGKLIFVDRPLGEVIDELNRYHRGRLQIIDPAIRSHRVSGVFSTGDPLAVVDALETSIGLHSTRLTRYLVLLHR